MMRTGLILAFLIAFAGGAITPVMAMTEKEAAIIAYRKERILKGIDGAWKSGKYAGLREHIDTHIDRFDKQAIVSEWAQKNFALSYSREPHIGFVYSEAQQKMAFKYRDTRNTAEYHQEMTTGLTMYIGSQIIAFENVAQCDDKAVGEHYLQPWLSGNVRKEYGTYIASLKPEEREAVWQDALKLVDTRNLDRKDKSLCASGADALARAQVANDCKAVRDKRGEVCNAEAYVKFVSDEAWKNARIRIQDAVKSRVQEGKL